MNKVRMIDMNWIEVVKIQNQVYIMVITLWLAL